MSPQKKPDGTAAGAETGEAAIEKTRHFRLEQLFLAAVDLSPEEQSVFVSRECGDDPDLSRMLNALLAEDRRGPLLPHPPAVDPASDDVGSRDLSGSIVSHYQVVQRIATGGMAAVYRAIDTRLQRTVALKILPSRAMSDEGGLHRFWREARIVASIDHPNVCPVYEIDAANDLLFIAMAYLDGTPLDQKIRRGPLHVEDALEITIQAARGLDAAHANDITHRDIKPGNLILSQTGSGKLLVRILDFGIAHWRAEAPFTHAGLTMGTVSYMAPEQIGQSQVDARADIWSLGVVLYEMLSGFAPFERESLRETLAAIVAPTPVDLTPLRRVVSGEALAVLGKMLSKDAGRRYQSARELIADLERTAQRLRSSPLAKRRKRKRWTVGILISAAIAATIALTRQIELMPNRPSLRIVPFTFYPGYEQNPAISPDGARIAYVGQGANGTNPLEVYVQRIGSSAPVRISRVMPDQDDRYPAWDSSGTRLAFIRSRRNSRFGRILLVPSAGGAAVDLGLDSVLGFGGLAWNPKGGTLAFTRVYGANQGAIFEYSFDDHAIRQQSFPGEGQTDCCPEFNPDGSRLAFKRNGVEIVVTDESGGTIRRLRALAAWPGLTWSANGRSLIYSWFGKIGQVDLSGAAITRAAAGDIGFQVMDVTVRGSTMACVRWDFEHKIWELKMHRVAEHRISMVSKAAFIASSSQDDTPQFSPDGKWIAFASTRSGSLSQIWISSRDGSNARRLTFFDSDFAGTPRWSPDGKNIVFDRRPPSSKPDIYVIPAAGGAPIRVTTRPEGADVPSWSQDGRWIYFHSGADDQIWKTPAGGGKPVQVTRNGGFESFESADGKLLFHSKADAGQGLWKLDIASGKESPIPALAGAGDYRHWAPARSGIYFVPNREADSAQAAIRFFDFKTGQVIRVATIGSLLRAGPGALTVSPDETSLLYVPPGRDNRDIMLLEHFQ